MKNQENKQEGNKAEKSITPCIRCNGTDKTATDNTFCRHCEKSLLSLMNGGF